MKKNNPFAESWSDRNVGSQEKQNNMVQHIRLVRRAKNLADAVKFGMIIMAGIFIGMILTGQIHYGA